MELSKKKQPPNKRNNFVENSSQNQSKENSPVNNINVTPNANSQQLEKFLLLKPQRRRSAQYNRNLMSILKGAFDQNSKGNIPQPATQSIPLQVRLERIHTEGRIEKVKEREISYLELVETEDAFVSDLDILVEYYIKPIREESILNEQEITNIFVNIEQILELNRSLLTHFQAHSSVCPGFEVMENSWVTYSTYCSKQNDQLRYLKEYEKNNPKFKTILHENSLRVECRLLTLEDFLIKPMQRLCKYPLLLKELIKHTPVDSDERLRLSRVKKSLEHKVSQINQCIAYKEKMTTSLWPQFQKTHLPEGEYSRFSVLDVIKEGKLQQVNIKKTEWYLFLLPDRLLLCMYHLLPSSSSILTAVSVVGLGERTEPHSVGEPNNIGGHHQGVNIRVKHTALFTETKLTSFMRGKNKVLEISCSKLHKRIYLLLSASSNYDSDLWINSFSSVSSSYLSMNSKINHLLSSPATPKLNHKHVTEEPISSRIDYSLMSTVSPSSNRIKNKVKRPTPTVKMRSPDKMDDLLPLSLNPSLLTSDDTIRFDFDDNEISNEKYNPKHLHREGTLLEFDVEQIEEPYQNDTGHSESEDEQDEQTKPQEVEKEKSSFGKKNTFFVSARPVGERISPLIGASRRGFASPFSGLGLAPEDRDSLLGSREQLFALQQQNPLLLPPLERFYIGSM